MIQQTLELGKETQQKRVLRMLKDAGKYGVTSQGFYGEYLPRFAARIFELKKLGHDIRRKPIGGSMYNYYLVEEQEYGDVE